MPEATRIELGTAVRDVITKWEGRVVGIVQYLTGCDQALVVPSGLLEGKIQSGEWFDVNRLEVLIADPIELPDNGAPDRSEPARTRRTPGADRLPTRTH